MLHLARMTVHSHFDCRKTVLKEAGVIQIWFFHAPGTDESAHATEKTCVFRMTMVYWRIVPWWPSAPFGLCCDSTFNVTQKYVHIKGL